jgi:hypothetical protein
MPCQEILTLILKSTLRYRDFLACERTRQR